MLADEINGAMADYPDPVAQRMSAHNNISLADDVFLRWVHGAIVPDLKKRVADFGQQ